MFADLDELLECPTCGTDGLAWEDCFLGLLGDALHFRCRACGASWTEFDDSEDHTFFEPESAAPVEKGPFHVEATGADTFRLHRKH